MLEANDMVCSFNTSLGTLGLHSDGIKLMVREDQAQKALRLIDASKDHNDIP